MADELADNAEAIGFYIILYRARNIKDAFARGRLSNALIQRFLGNIHQLLGQNATAADGHSSRRIADKTVKDHPNVQAHDVTELELARTSQTVHNLVVNRDTNMTGILAVTQKGALSAIMLDPVGRELIDLTGGNARL